MSKTAELIVRMEDAQKRLAQAHKAYELSIRNRHLPSGEKMYQQSQAVIEATKNEIAELQEQLSRARRGK